eukprot:scaffold26213_cov73-Skeletonema_marinoi.AAC.1
MRFGDKFLNGQHPPWQQSYIDYIRLKQLIYQLFDLEHATHENNFDIIESPSSDVSSSSRHLPNIKTSNEFQQQLNNEVQKALLFLLRTLGEMASELSELSEEFITLSANVQLQLNASDLLEQIHALRMQFVDRVGSKLLLLLEFIELNVEAITKIVKKHDKAVSRWEESSGGHNHGDDQPRYQRLRTQYLPRFAVHSTNANDDEFLPLSRHRSLSFGFELNLSSPSKQRQSSEAPFFEPMLYRIHSTRKRLGQSTNRYNRMVYAHEMLGDDTHDDNNQSQMETRFGSIENMQKLRSQSIGGDLDGGPPSPM